MRGRGRKENKDGYTEGGKEEWKERKNRGTDRKGEGNEGSRKEGKKKAYK